MNTDQTPEQLVRVGILVSLTRTRADLLPVDEFGNVPDYFHDGDRRYRLHTKPNSPIAVYSLIDPANDAKLSAALTELVAVADGLPNVSGEVDAQHAKMQEAIDALLLANEQQAKQNHDLRLQARTAEKLREDRAERASRAVHNAVNREQHAAEKVEAAQIELAQYKEHHRLIVDLNTALGHRVGKIIEQAGKWKQRALAAEHQAEQDHAEWQTMAADLARLSDVERNLQDTQADLHDARAELQEARANALSTITRITEQLPPLIETRAIDAEVVNYDGPILTVYSSDIGGLDAEVRAYLSPSGIPVVQIDTSSTGRVRVNLNEGVIWDGDPESDERPGRWAEPLPHEEEPGVYHSPNSLGVLAEYQAIIAEQARTVEEGTEKIEQGTRVISIQLDTIRDQTEKIVRVENERDELLQALKNRNGEGDPADPGAHGGTIPRYGMLDLWQAIRGDAGAGFEEWYDSLGYAEAWSALLMQVRLLRTETSGAETIKALTHDLSAARDEADSLRERSDAWERVYYHPNLRQFTEEDGVAVDQVMEGISKLAEWREAIREEYVTEVAKRRATETERDEHAETAQQLREQLYQAKADHQETARAHGDELHGQAEYYRAIIQQHVDGSSQAQRGIWAKVREAAGIATGDHQDPLPVISAMRNALASCSTPDVVAEANETIKQLRLELTERLTEIQNLQADLHIAREHARNVVAKAGREHAEHVVEIEKARGRETLLRNQLAIRDTIAGIRQDSEAIRTHRTRTATVPGSDQTRDLLGLQVLPPEATDEAQKRYGDLRRQTLRLLDAMDSRRRRAVRAAQDDLRPLLHSQLVTQEAKTAPATSPYFPQDFTPGA